MAVSVRNLARDRRGVAAIEFALIAPVLFLLLVAFLDVAYLARGYLRVQTTATQLGQIISQCTTVSSSDDAQIINLASRTLGPFLKNGKKWAVVVTAIGPSATNQPERWWAIDNRTSEMQSDAKFATDGAGLPAGFGLVAGQAMFRTEVFVELDSMLFTKANSLLAKLMGSRNPIANVSTSLMHSSRAPDASRLRTKTSTTGACLS